MGNYIQKFTSLFITTCILTIHFLHAQTISTLIGTKSWPFENKPANAANVNPNSSVVDKNGNLYFTDNVYNVIRKVSAAGIITTIAGNGEFGFSGDGGKALQAKFNSLSSITIDNKGKLYVGDANKIRTIDSNGIINTIAGVDSIVIGGGEGGMAKLTQLGNVSSIAIDSNENILFTDGGKIKKISSSGIIGTIAGGNWSFNGKAANTACIQPNRAITNDNAGNIYFYDQTYRVVRKVSTTGIITTVVGNGVTAFSGDGGQALNASIESCSALCIDTQGNLYLASNSRIRKVNSSGIISTIAGTGVLGTTGDGGAALLANIRSIGGMTVDVNNNLLFTQTSGSVVIRAVNLNTGIISKIAGTGMSGYTGDGQLAVNAAINTSFNIVSDSFGNIFFYEGSNRVIRKISTQGIITTYQQNAVNGFTVRRQISALAIDPLNNIYVAATDGLVQKINSNGIITIVSGSLTNTTGYSGDGDLAILAKFNGVNGLTVDRVGNIFLSELNNNRIRKINTSGIVSTLAGNGFASYFGDGQVSALALFNNPNGLAIDKNNNIYIADVRNNCIRKINSSGIISTIAGNGISGTPTEAASATSVNLSNLKGITLDQSNNIYIINDYSIRKISNTGIITSIAGNNSSTPTGENGPAISISLNSLNGQGLSGLTSDNLGNLFINDLGNNKIRKISTYGNINTVVGNGKGSFYGDGGPARMAGVSTPFSIHSDRLGNIYFFDQMGSIIRKIDNNGIISVLTGSVNNYGSTGDNGVASNALIGNNEDGYYYDNYGKQISSDSIGNIFFTDIFNQKIRKISNTGIISTIAGTGINGNTGNGGAAINANLDYPSGVAIDKKGNIYISDGFSTIRKISKDGIINNYAGRSNSNGFSGDGGLASNALLSYPNQIAFDSIGNLYFGDNNRIRKIDTNGIITTILGNGISGINGDGGLAINAESTMIGSIIFDKEGDLYFTQGYSMIRKINMKTNIVNAITSYTSNLTRIVDGSPAINVDFYGTISIAFDKEGNLLVADPDYKSIRIINFANLNPSISNLTFKNCFNANSTIKSFSISASGLTNSVNIIGSKNVEISRDSLEGYVQSLVINNTKDSLGRTKLFSRIKTGTSAGNFIDTIAISSNGAATKYLLIQDTVLSLPSAPVVANTSYCIGSTANVLSATATTGATLSWYGLNANGGLATTSPPAPSTSTAGVFNYYVSQLSTATGCESARAKISVTINPIPSTPILSRDSLNNLVASVNGITWYKEGAALADTSQKFKPPSPGSYTARTTQNGCASALSNPYYYLVTDVINLSADEFIKLAPNPFINQLNLDFVIKGYQRLNLEVFDLATGIRKSSMQNLTPGMPIYLGQLSTGTYYVRVSSKDGKINYQFKMIKL